jgi:hypothetical protein
MLARQRRAASNAASPFDGRWARLLTKTHTAAWMLDAGCFGSNGATESTMLHDGACTSSFHMGVPLWVFVLIPNIRAVKGAACLW